MQEHVLATPRTARYFTLGLPQGATDVWFVWHGDGVPVGGVRRGAHRPAAGLGRGSAARSRSRGRARERTPARPEPDARLWNEGSVLHAEDRRDYGVASQAAQGRLRANTVRWRARNRRGNAAESDLAPHVWIQHIPQR